MAISTSPSSVSRFVFGQHVVDDRAITTRHLAALVARSTLAAIFLVSGFAKFTDPVGAIGYMTAKGIPAADTMVYVAGAAEILGALAIMAGLVTRIGAIGLFVFLVITTITMHDFWNLAGADQKTQMVQFMKNLSIMGGLLMLVAAGAGRYSLDALFAGGGPITHDRRRLPLPAAYQHTVPSRHRGF